MSTQNSALESITKFLLQERTAIPHRSAHSPQTVQYNWEQARLCSIDPTGHAFRCDIYGKLISRAKYGKRNEPFGWEIDHIIPVAKGGSNDLHNLQPLHWLNNCLKTDKV